MEASRRLSYLADIVDTEGWAIKHSVAPTQTAVREEYSNEAMQQKIMIIHGALSNVDNYFLSTTIAEDSKLCKILI